MNLAPHAETHPFNTQQLLQIHADTLFISDAAGRLRFNADPGYPEHELESAPRFWLGRTDQGVLWRLRADLPADLHASLEAIAQTIPLRADPMVLPPQIAAIQAVLAVHAPIYELATGPCYWMPQSLPVPAITLVITPANADALAAHFPWKQSQRALHAAGPLVATIVDQQAVAVCYCARLNAVAAEAGVETTESARGHGYAQAAVAGWAAAIRGLGILPMYSTSWDNYASQGIARRLGMHEYADTCWIQ
ncbi:GNAT family N-acetyltransferase [Herpetosiphon llansteffanensis]